MKNNKNKILFIGRFQPPVHGASLMNELYFNSKVLNARFKLKKIKINRYDDIKQMGLINIKKIFGVFNVFFDLFKNLIFFKPNLIYFELAPTGFAFLRDSIYIFLCKLFGKKIIFQIHARGINKAISNKLLEKYYKFIFKNTKMILLSQLLYSEVEKVIPKGNIYILPNGIKNQISDKEFNKILTQRKKGKKPVLLFLSNMIEEKGALDVLKICNELNKKNLDFECLFVGPWQNKEFEKKWKTFLKEYKLKNKCKYLGSKYGKEKQEIFEKTNFLIFPTIYKNESFPLVILEAFMVGIPVFSYNNGAIKEMVSKDYLGKVVNIGNWEELEKEIEKRSKKKIDSKRIREHFKKNYTLEIAEKKLIKIFEKELID